MNYNIKGTGVEVSDELRSYVERRLAHADKFVLGDPTAHANVELEYSAPRDGGKYCAEFNVALGGELYRAVEWGTTLHEAIDLAGGEFVKELSRDKKKRLQMFRRTAVKVKEYLRGWRTKV